MTREEAKEVFLNRGFIDGIYNGDKWREACIVISKWLEQEPILDKARAEIDKARFIDKDTRICKNALASGLEVAMQIIDKYKAESEK